MSLIEKSSWANSSLVCCIVAMVVLGSQVNAQTGGSRFTMPVVPVIGRSFDAAKDFSITNNPSGPWSYGSSPSRSADFTLFSEAVRNIPEHKQLECWRGAASLAHSRAEGTIRYNIYTVHPPDYLSLHPGSSGQRSVLRFTVPGRGSYKVQGSFKAIDHTTTDPHVLVNGKDVVKLKPIDGSHNQSEFSFTQQFDKGDTIDFAVGDGGNGYGFDSTGLKVTVTPTVMAAGGIGSVPEPIPTAVVGRKSPELVTLSANYGRQFKAINAEGQERIKRLRAEYAVGLAELEKAAQAKGDLDSVLVVRAESARLVKGTEPSEEEKAAMPNALTKIRGQYTEALTRYLTELQEKQVQVQKLYLTDLEALERQLTQRGNIEGAMEVRRERAQVAGSVAK